MGRAKINDDNLWDTACRIARRQPRWIREDARQAAALAGLEALRAGLIGPLVWVRMAHAARRERRVMEKPVPRESADGRHVFIEEIEGQNVLEDEMRFVDFFADLSNEEQRFAEIRYEGATMSQAMAQLGWTKYKTYQVRDMVKQKWEGE